MRTWDAVSAKIRIGDKIPYWSSYQRREKTPFFVRAVEPRVIIIEIPTSSKPVRVTRHSFNRIVPHYEAYATRSLTSAEYRGVKNLTGVMSYVVSMIRHLERMPSEEATLRAKLVQMLQGMKSREAASGKLQQSTAPDRKVETSLEDLSLLWAQAGGNCGLCGQAIPLETHNMLLQMSPDRVDNMNGVYSYENTRITHLGCNLGRNTASISDFQEWLASICTNRGSN